MIVPNCKLGAEGIFYLLIVRKPKSTAEQLAEIAIASAESTRKLIGVDPK